jgi:hypothetical protein
MNREQQMSYYVKMYDPETKKTVNFKYKHGYQGSNFILGGTTEAFVNITYNYAKYYKETIDKDTGLYSLHNKTGKEALPIIQKAINELGIDYNENYWAATRGNAGYALLAIEFFCRMRPDGIIKVD